jgi:hypothetical protein
MLDYGYAVVMMHPYEFSMYENGFYANKVNATRVQELSSLIDKLQSKHVKILTIGSIQDYDVVIAPSFADIFYNNCFKNGILPITINKATVDELAHVNSEIEVNLETQTIKYDNKTVQFLIDAARKKTLLEGLDDIAITLLYQDKISSFEQNHKI